MDQPLPTDPHAEIRDEVAKLCARFPGEYWRKLDRDRAYPTEFVHALTEAGYLAALIPEEYGGAGLPLSAAAAILETIHAEGCNGAACHAQMYIMGTILRHGSPQAEAGVPAEDRHRRTAPAGVRRHRADQRHRHHLAAHLRQTRRRPLRGERPEGLDQPRRALRPDAAARAHHAARPGEAAHRRAVHLHRRHARQRRPRPDHPADPHHDEPQLHRDLLRQHGRAGREPGRRGRPRLPLHPRRHERRAPADRRRMHRRCALVPEEGHRLRARPPGVRPADRAEPGHPVPARPRLRADARRRTDDPRGLRRSSRPA